MKIKHLAIAILLLFIVSSIKAQAVKNGDFENWTPLNGNVNLPTPDHWKCYNVLAFSNPVCLNVWQEISSYKIIAGKNNIKFAQSVKAGIYAGRFVADDSKEQGIEKINYQP